MMQSKMKNNQGFTIVELLVAIAIASVVMTAIFYTFKSQQDSYVVQTQVTAAQQNVRAAIYMMTRDIQMTGYYTNFDSGTYTMDWDDLGGTESIRPLIYARDNVTTAGDGVKDGTDVIVVVKASHDTNDRKQLGAGDSASGNTININPAGLGLGAGSCILMVEEDLTKAEFSEVQAVGGSSITLPGNLSETYGAGDWVYVVHVIVYYVSEDAQNPSLMRHRLGPGLNPEIVAENIDNLQLRYLLNTGAWADSGFDERKVRAVELNLLSRTRKEIRGYTDPNTYNIGNNPDPTPGDGYRRRLLQSVIKTRNIGL